MKNMTKGLAVLTLAVLMFAFAGQARAFCVHNMSDMTWQVEQTKNDSFWKGFNVTLAPTDKACCNWSNTDCNKSGGQTDPVVFRVAIDQIMWDYRRLIEVCRDYEIPANGDLYIFKVNGKYVCGQTPPPLPFQPPPPPPPPFPGP